ncbi:hypothetical protein [Sediminibacillus albus]|uniref:hypothetical protein n=1 Tax=Sediminibacillus albus TaxID=407036 RepID=UPI0011138635|nr:hypothetical protein [Sediminibacillus albus]
MEHNIHSLAKIERWQHRKVYKTIFEHSIDDEKEYIWRLTVVLDKYSYGVISSKSETFVYC